MSENGEKMSTTQIYIRFTVTEEERNLKIFTCKKLESENFYFSSLTKQWETLALQYITRVIQPNDLLSKVFWDAY